MPSSETTEAELEAKLKISSIAAKEIAEKAWFIEIALPRLSQAYSSKHVASTKEFGLFYKDRQLTGGLSIAIDLLRNDLGNPARRMWREFIEIKELLSELEEISKIHKIQHPDGIQGILTEVFKIRTAQDRLKTSIKKMSEAREIYENLDEIYSWDTLVYQNAYEGSIGFKEMNSVRRIIHFLNVLIK